MRKSTSRKNTIRSYLILLCAIGGIVIVSQWAWGHYERNTRAQALYQEARVKQEKAQERLQELQQRNALLDTDTGKQDVLVSRYALKLPGERVLILVEDKSLDTQEVSQKEPTVWERVRSWFGG